MREKWQVYIILCSDDTLYTGIATDVARRFWEHENGRGAKYFRGRRPLRVVYTETGHTRSSASRREYQIKRLTRPEKELLVAQGGRELPPAAAPGAPAGGDVRTVPAAPA